MGIEAAAEATIEATATFAITGWDEQPLQAIEGAAKLTRATVTQAYSGTIEGTSSVDYLMAYTMQGTARFVGIERVSGSVAGRAGSFVIEHRGSFEDGKAKSTWSVIAGCGTGELASLRAEGSYMAGHGEPAQVTFAYAFG